MKYCEELPKRVEGKQKRRKIQVTAPDVVDMKKRRRTKWLNIFCDCLCSQLSFYYNSIVKIRNDIKKLKENNYE